MRSVGIFQSVRKFARRSGWDSASTECGGSGSSQEAYNIRGFGAEYKAVIGDNGTFNIPSLTAGTYTATLSMPNFKQSITKNIVLQVGQPTSVRIVLMVGGRTETVTVTAGAEVIQTVLRFNF